jgi:hypothetical protein
VTALDLIVNVLATKRIVRLVTQDEITRPLREKIGRKDPRLAYLVGCKSCSSVWAGLLNVYAMPRSVKVALALSESAILIDLAASSIEEI